MATIGLRHPFWDGKKKKFLVSITMAGLMLILLFLGDLSYLYGTIFRSGYRVHALNILAVDFDGGLIGQSLTTAYSELEGSDFPGLHFRNVSEYPTVKDVRNAVCRGDFWGAVISQPGASDRLSAALGGGTAASDYNASNTLTYVYNGARYAAVALGDIAGNLETLIGASSSAYHALNGTEALNSLNASDSAAVLALLNPITASDIDIKTTPQGARVLYNTITVVLPIIQQFFFLMALNGINGSFGVYGRLKDSRIGILRMVISLIYTFLASLTVAGYIWAFKENWILNGAQFVLTWITFWLYMHINFLVLDTATAFVPMSFISFFVLTWVIFNVSSTIYPFELIPGFYRWAYALPSHEMYSILVQIWSGGCNNQLYRALPILFAWEVAGMVGAIAGCLHRNRNARKEVLDLEEKESREEMTGDDNRAFTNDTTALERIENRAAGPGMSMPFLAYTVRNNRTQSSGAIPTTRRRQGTI